MKAAVRVDWTEYERGWGSRPDGTSLHRDMETAIAFIRERTAHHTQAVAPDEYSAPGEPRIVEVSETMHEHLQHHFNFWISPRTWPSSEEIRTSAIP